MHAENSFQHATNNFYFLIYQWEQVKTKKEKKKDIEWELKKHQQPRPPTKKSTKNPQENHTTTQNEWQPLFKKTPNYKPLF